MNHNVYTTRNNIKAIWCLLIVFSFGFTSCETNSISELAAAAADDTIDVVTYENRAMEILNNSCVECHNINEQTAGVRLDAYEFAFIEANNGRMLSRMMDTTNPMPPSGNLPDIIIEDIVNWVDNGILEN
ncbi:c-type cytochrome domain-containing protein [Dokdonia sp.]|uniref:c-type cytochrome domain-containing protein n=1 Tax=Dokdonia sp. TaxID=2024995 RepID=UPI003267DB46